MESYDLGYRFKRIHECFRANGNRRAKNFGLTKAQMDILFYLFKADKEITQRDLELHFGIKHSTARGILGRMEKNGFVTVSVSKTDKRQRCISLSQKAYDVQSDCKVQREHIEKRFTQRFTKEELDTLTSLLDKTYDILKEDNTND
ncbi:MAG: MarR family transcriptional regulator [Clostridia bacterium]|nr:MarR family transcriptional regulator [Clostridia bacterium]